MMPITAPPSETRELCGGGVRRCEDGEERGPVPAASASAAAGSRKGEASALKCVGAHAERTAWPPKTPQWRTHQITRPNP